MVERQLGCCGSGASIVDLKSWTCEPSAERFGDMDNKFNDIKIKVKQTGLRIISKKTKEMINTRRCRYGTSR